MVPYVGPPVRMVCADNVHGGAFLALASRMGKSILERCACKQKQRNCWAKQQGRQRGSRRHGHGEGVDEVHLSGTERASWDAHDVHTVDRQTVSKKSKTKMSQPSIAGNFDGTGERAGDLTVTCPDSLPTAGSAEEVTTGKN